MNAQLALFTTVCLPCRLTCNYCSLQGEYCSELMPPTPPPRRIRLGLGGGCMATTPAQQPVRHTTQSSFSRIASGLKLAQAQAMAVAGFLPEPQHWPSLIIDCENDANGDTGRHARCSLLNHRASFHGRGQPY